jgi:hypothetical protein
MFALICAKSSAFSVTDGSAEALAVPLTGMAMVMPGFADWSAKWGRKV